MRNAGAPDRAVTVGFILAGAYNVFGMLLVSMCFTNPLLNATEPAVFSWLGQVAVVLWGLAYWAVARSYGHVPYLLLVYFVEKMVYSTIWLLWLLQRGHSLSNIASESPLTAVFFGSYGVGDFGFGLFFGWVALKVLRGSRDTSDEPAATAAGGGR